MIVITIYKDQPNDAISVVFTNNEWEFIKSHLLENALEFHSAIYNEFQEFAMDLANANEKLHTINFSDCPQVLHKLKLLGINTFDIEKSIEQTTK